MRKLRLLTLVFCLSLFSCDEDNRDVELYFMGDSLVQLWDIENDFPSYITHNWGQSGSGIYYLMDLPKVPEEAITVVITGTNELKPARTEQEWQQYIELYLKTISEVGGRYVILLPVFPTEMGWQENIPTINRLVKEQTVLYENIKYLDLYPLFESGGTIHQEYTSDGLHLSRQGYAVIASHIHEMLKNNRQ